MLRVTLPVLVAFVVGCGSQALNVGANGDGGTRVGDNTTPPGSDAGSNDTQSTSPGKCPNWRLVPGPYQPNGFMSSPNMTAMADLNGDGKLDVIVGADDEVDILLGDGDGRVDAPVPSLGIYGSVAIGDLNGDRKLDFANGSFVALGNGDGTFQMSFLTDLPGGAPQLADMNGDGKTDLITGGGISGVLVALGNGDGTFLPHRTTPAAAYVSNVAVGDFNQDGKLDVAALDQTGGAVDVLLGWGDGNLQPPFAYAISSSPTWVAPVDLDGDGLPDLAIIDDPGNYLGTGGPPGDGGGVGLIYGRQDGSFANWQLFGSTTPPTAAAIGDLNEDGVPDVAVVQRRTNTVSVLMSSGRGKYAWVPGHVTGSGPNSIALGDLNGDGHLDMAIANPASNSVTILLSLCN